MHTANALTDLSAVAARTLYAPAAPLGMANDTPGGTEPYASVVTTSGEVVKATNVPPPGVDSIPKVRLIDGGNPEPLTPTGTVAGTDTACRTSAAEPATLMLVDAT